MSLLTEIELNQDRIAAAQEEAKKLEQFSNPRYTELPDGFYIPKQLDKYLNADGIITRTTDEFMRELSAPYTLTRNFIITNPDTPVLLGGPRKDMYYHLTIGEEDGQNKKTTLRYNNGGVTMQSLSLHRLGIPLLVPEKKRNDHSYEVRDLINWLSSPKATHFTYPLVTLYDISSKGVRDFLTLIVSNPEYKFLIPLKVVS